TDLLAATDWFFPEGMNHHTMFTRFKTLNRVMQKVARRIAGIGELPDAVLPPVAAREEQAEVLIVGAGLAGLTLAAELHAAGRRCVVLDEEDTLAPWCRVGQGPEEAVMARALAAPPEELDLRTGHS